MNPNHSRYSGPDLERLLDDVRAEHGEDVAIVEANKIRTGGVGGFFAKEVFEIVVDTEATGDTMTLADAGELAATMRERLLPDDLDIVPGSEEEAGLLRAGDLAAETLDEAPGFADLLRQELGRQWVADTAEDAFGAAPESDERRAALLDDDRIAPTRRSDDTVERRPAPAASVSDLRSGDDDVAALRAQVVRPLEIADYHEPPPTDRRRPVDRSGPLVEPARSPSTSAPTSGPGSVGAERANPVHRNPVRGRSGIWARLSSAHDEPSLVTSFDDSGTVVIVGDLEPAMLAARRRQRDRLLGSGQLLVLSDRGEVTGLPSWQYVEDEASLVASLDAGPDRRLVVIDAPADAPGLGPLLGRLRTRMAVLAMAGAPEVDELTRAVHAAGVPAAVDLVAPVAAEKVVAYIDAGIPLWSIGGHRLTPELIVALRADVALRD